MPNFAFSYNITSLTKKMRNALNRERTNVGRTAYSDRIKDMLLESRSGAVADVLAGELQKVERGTNCEEVAWNDVAVHACKILNALGKAIFVTSSQIQSHGDAIDHARSDGMKVITVSDHIAANLRGLTDFAGNPVRDLDAYRTEWAQSFQFSFIAPKDLHSRERAVFDRRDAIARLVGGFPKAVKTIKVSETMRPDFEGWDHIEGLWDPASGAIIVRRDQVRNLRTFAGTLLHEIAHARSGEPDISRGFEHELTEMLGQIAGSKKGWPWSRP